MGRYLKFSRYDFDLSVTFAFSSSDDHNTKGSGLAPWPARLTTAPPRLADFGYSSDMFDKDTVMENMLTLIIIFLKCPSC